MKKSIGKPVLLKIKLALVTGAALVTLSPIVAYLLAPIGCVLFPQIDDPRVWHILPVCSGVNFVAFWIILGIILILGTTIAIYGIRGFKLNKSS